MINTKKVDPKISIKSETGQTILHCKRAGPHYRSQDFTRKPTSADNCNLSKFC